MSDPNLLTFLIADIRGYSTFTRERGDAAAALLAQKFADLARDAVEARSGRVIELRGDEAFAVFDTSAQAVRAAVELQATFAEESQLDPAFQLPVGIGIDAGEAVPVEGGYRGVAVNMAARLCSSAAAGQVLVTRAVTDLVGATDDLVFAERGRATFKGFEEPAEVIEALALARPRETKAAPPLEAAGPVPSDRVLPPELDPMTPLVDRDREMRWLRGTWRQVRRGHGRVLMVSGPAQIGKTRLAAEIATHIHSSGAAVRYAGPGGAGTALALASIRDARGARAPTLFVLDDIDVAGPAASQALLESFNDLGALRVLVVGVLRDHTASPELASLIERADERGDGHRVLAPFELDDVRGIVRLYVGDAETEAPVETFARASDGVPGRVHELVSEWTRTEASRRLSAAAEFLATGRERHASNLEFANNAIALKLGRLYTVGGRDVSTTEVCPYKGLAQFEAGDSAYFFGRERLVGELAARTVGAGFLGVVGASGSGKSSAIAAGLLPSLDAGLLPGSERWTHVSMRPGEHPLAELCRLLGSDAEDPLDTTIASQVDGRLVLVVDQFEETFTTCGDETERAAFIGALTNAAGRRPERLVVIAAIRGDYYAHSAGYPELAAVVAGNHVLVGPLTREELRRAIELPARRAGLRIESALVDALVDEVTDEPGGLPLLSTALVELWQAREGGWLRMNTYERTGGVRGAVARLAEASYAALSVPEQAAARRVFLRLVVIDAAEATSRRRVSLDEFDLGRDEAAAGLIARLTQDRLLTMSDDTVEVAHEALLREWPRLRGWLEEDVQGRELHHHLMEAAREWSAGGQEAADLYRGARLSSALDWTAEHTVELNEQERAFLEHSREATQAEVEHARRSNRRLKASLVGVALFLVVALIGGTLAVQQRGRARDSARTADARNLSAQALDESQPLDRSLLLAVAAAHLDDSIGSRGALLASLLKRPEAVGVMTGAGQLASVGLTPDGRTLVVRSTLSDVEGEVLFFDTASLQQVGEPVRFGEIGALAVSPNGRYVAVTSSAPTAIDLIDVATHAIVWRKTLADAWSASGSVTFSPDGKRVAVDHVAAPAPFKPANKESIEIYDVQTRRHVDSLSLPRVNVYGTTIAYVEGGAKIVSSTLFGSTEVWDLRSGRVVRRFPFGGSVAVAPDGETLAVTKAAFDPSNPSTIVTVDLRTGHRLAPISERPEGGFALAFSPDGKRLASTNASDGTLTVWAVKDGHKLETFAGHGRSFGTTFSPDGRTLYASGEDGRVIAWDTSGQGGFVRHISVTFTGPLLIGIPYASSPDGTTLAIPRDHTKNDLSRYVDLWNLATLKRIDTLSVGNVGALAFSPDGSILAASTYQLNDRTYGAGGDLFRGRVSLWDLSTGSRAASWRWGGGPIYGLAFSPDGRILAAGGDDYAVEKYLNRPKRWTASYRLWDVASGRHSLVHRFRLRGSASYPVFSPDGRFMMGETCCTFGASKLIPLKAAIWDVSSGQEMFEPKVSAGIWRPAFSPDSRTLAVGDLDGSVTFYDVPSGQVNGPPIANPGEKIESVAFSPDGTRFVTTSNSGAVQVWDSATRQKFGPVLPRPPEGAPLAQFTPDGKSVVGTFSTQDGVASIYVWDFEPASWKARACAIAGRNLTPEEWSQYLPDRPYEVLCPE